jgi:hypothetical protein
MLNTVVLSDLHFGEPYGLVHDQGVPPVLNLINAHARGRLRRLVLAGDIFEMSTPESMDRLRRESRFFMQQARSRFQIDEVIWVPGNHDYTLFRRLVPDLLSTDPRGDLAPREFVEEFFGDWRGAVRIAYPHLLLHERRGGRPGGQAWIIHHGHLMDRLVLGRTLRDRTRAFFSALGGGSLISPTEVSLTAPHTLPQIEAQVRPVLLGIWCHHPDPNNLQSDAWQLVRRWESYLSCPARQPDLVVRDDSEVDLLSVDHEELAAFYLRALRRDPACPLPPGARLTLVWGHSHEGGTRLMQVDGAPVRLINLGGWVPGEGPTQLGREAHTHIFFINDDLQDMMLTAPFPGDWVRRCLDHGRSVFAIPGPDDELIERVRNAPPAAGMSVDEMLRWQEQRPFGHTRSDEDPFA